MANSRTPSLTAMMFVALFLLSVSLGCARSGDAADASTRPAQVASHAPVVIELFTSEGCSSCPPADGLLAELISEAQAHGQPVYCMAFHVDYWDRLGWRDPFSSAAFSTRQHRYAAAFGSDQVYTPQLVINGKSGFDGSDAAEARRQIRAAMEGPVATEVVMKAEKTAGGLTVAYRVRDAPEDAVLNVALVERSVTTRVERGENAGRTLRHANVVRAFGTASLSKSNSASIDLTPPESLEPANALLIGFVQDQKTMVIAGASTADLPR